MAPFTILPDALEDELHGQRLLRVEERPLEKIKNRLLGQSTPFHRYLVLQTTSPESPTDDARTNDEDANSKENQPDPFSPEHHAKFLKDLQRFREDVILDFAAFETSIARIQFLRDANEKERQRYAAEKLKIEVTAEEVRNDTARLKVRLEEAQKTLEIRKGYDELAETITQDSRLKPRDEQLSNIERLKLEIEELKNEGHELDNAWVERREQFARVVDEGQRLRRIVRDEKEPEHEDKGDGDEERDDDDDDEDAHRSEGEENMLGVEGQRGEGSITGTPRPMGDEDAPTPLPEHPENDAMTPRSHIMDADSSTAKYETGQPGGDTNMHDGGSDEQRLPVIKVDDEMDTT